MTNYRSGFSVGEHVKPKQVSEEFIQALINAGCRKGLVDSLRPKEPSIFVRFIKKILGK